MQFKICDNKTLCLDLRELSKEEIMLVISTVSSTCECLEEAGHILKVTINTSKHVKNKQQQKF